MSYKQGLNIFKKKAKRTKKIYCSPKNEKNDFSCFSKESIIKIINAWNKNKNNKNKIKINKSDNVPKLWKKINKKLSKNCYGEWCWIQQDFVKQLGDKEIKETFRPKTPKAWYKKKTDWLSTIDIENVLNQYEKVHDDFQFIGAVPIDFDYEYSMGKCVIDELCKIKIENNIKNNKTKIGIVFNLDKHDQEGSHWNCMYVDLNKNIIYYFDSYGDKPPKEIKKLIDRILKQGNKIGRKIDYVYNKVRHQYKHSECGTYCMNLIVSLLEGKTFESLTDKRIKDDTILLKRDYFYAPSE